MVTRDVFLIRPSTGLPDKAREAKLSAVQLYLCISNVRSIYAQQVESNCWALSFRGFKLLTPVHPSHWLTIPMTTGCEISKQALRQGECVAGHQVVASCRKKSQDLDDNKQNIATHDTSEKLTRVSLRILRKFFAVFFITQTYR